MHRACRLLCRLFFFNDTATTEIYTLSLHDALPISRSVSVRSRRTPGSANRASGSQNARCTSALATKAGRDVSANTRSEEHTSELQSLAYLVCRLLLEKKIKTEVCFGIGAPLAACYK